MGVKAAAAPADTACDDSQTQPRDQHGARRACCRARHYHRHCGRHDRRRRRCSLHRSRDNRESGRRLRRFRSQQPRRRARPPPGRRHRRQRHLPLLRRSRRLSAGVPRRRRRLLLRRRPVHRVLGVPRRVCTNPPRHRHHDRQDDRDLCSCRRHGHLARHQVLLGVPDPRRRLGNLVHPPEQRHRGHRRRARLGHRSGHRDRHPRAGGSADRVGR